MKLTDKAIKAAKPDTSPDNNKPLDGTYEILQMRLFPNLLLHRPNLSKPAAMLAEHIIRHLEHATLAT